MTTMSATTTHYFAAGDLTAFHRWHLVGALLMLALLVLLPAFGVGPHAWKSTAAAGLSAPGADASSATMTAAPTTSPPAAAPTTSPPAAAAPAGGTSGTSGSSAVVVPTPPPVGPIAAVGPGPSESVVATGLAPAPGAPANSLATAVTTAPVPAAATPAANTAPVPSPAAPAIAPDPAGHSSGGAFVRIYFGFDSAVLPTGFREQLAGVIEQLEAQPSATAVVGGFHDTIGPQWSNERLARRRARAVQTALVEAGIEPSRIALAEPASGGSDREARRAEVSLRR
jgi:outer membrane protein OmpA-like peptidoglycan-associated protein